MTPTANEKVVLTTKDGYTLGLSNGKVVPAKVTGDQVLYSTCALSIEAYKENGSDSAEAVDLLALGTGTVHVQIVAGARTRVALSEPTGEGDAYHASFASTFGNSFQNKVDFYVQYRSADTVAGAFSITVGSASNSNAVENVYAAIGGDTTNLPKASYSLDGTETGQNDDSSAVSGSLTSNTYSAS